MNIQEYVAKMKAGHHFILSGTWRDIVTQPGRKYIKVCSILSNGQKCIIQFVEPITGNVYKAKSWRQKGRLLGNINNLF